DPLHAAGGGADGARGGRRRARAAGPPEPRPAADRPHLLALGRLRRSHARHLGEGRADHRGEDRGDPRGHRRAGGRARPGAIVEPASRARRPSDIIRLYMPIGTAFHPRTSALCESMSWRDWAGYFAVSTYEVHHERE